ncbi:MAG: J domain-containing protein [Gammaproteobacteria bacterium]|nr:J domain-containing protein [Gammaproteobacteria bacterium]
MILFAIKRDCVGSNFSSEWFLLSSRKEQVDKFDKETHLLVPWYMIYRSYERFKQDFLNFTCQFEIHEDSMIYSRVATYTDIYEKVLTTYASPIYGKLPAQELKEKVSNIDYDVDSDIDTCLNKWDKFLSDWNGDDWEKQINSNKFIVTSLLLIKNNPVFKKLKRKKNKAEYTICYADIDSVFNDLSAKSFAKATGYDYRIKKLAIMLKDSVGLYGRQLDLIESYLMDFESELFITNKEDIDSKVQKYLNGLPKGKFPESALNDKIKLKQQSIEREILSKKLKNGEYFDYFYSLNKKLFNLDSITSFSVLLEKYLDKKITNKKLLDRFSLVAIGAIIINDLRKISETQSPNRSCVLISQKTKGQLIDRTESKVNVIGRASFNNRIYQVGSNDAVTIANTRNLYYHRVGMTLGNGISGHMAGILTVFDAKTGSSKASTIACSMFTFWSLYYDKTVTAAHSFIEVFESISADFVSQSDYCELNFSHWQDHKDVYLVIENLCCNGKFNPIGFMSSGIDDSYQHNPLQKSLFSQELRIVPIQNTLTLGSQINQVQLNKAFSILKLSSNISITLKDIMKNYYKIALEVHPDRSTPENFEEKNRQFQELVAAMELLKDFIKGSRLNSGSQKMIL